MKITKLLVANRGEIALRIMRTARDMGIATVAVYSEADRQALHVRFADEAVLLGPAPSSASYLRMDALIEAARQTGAQAIHPGYGFLSENAAFARLVREAGLIFVGPSPESIDVMGSKLGAKAAVKDYNIPMVPGGDKAVTSVEEARQLAAQAGYPVLIKASAGGGGKGMRVVNHEDELEEQMTRAISEATSAFGDGSVFIEKYIRNPKHIEIQVLGDQHGNVVHLFERECSIQRRHQKVVEEAPSPVITPEVRQRMGADAVKVAQACGYFSTGTVEFVMDQDLNYYFLEMNTRLQVEHPVTELVTGLDLVEWQIRVAQGEALAFTQEQLSLRGHAIEVRVCAEDPANNFLPDVGTLHTYRRPQGPGIRLDDGFEEGMEIPVYYDPLIGKLITYGQDRDQAIRRMKRAIDQFQITGVATTLGFCRFVMDHPAFVDGSFDTGFVGQHFTPAMLEQPLNDTESRAAALLAQFLLSQGKPAAAEAAAAPAAQGSNWQRNRTRVA